MNTTLLNTIKAIDNHFFAGALRKLNRYRWKYQCYWLGKQLVVYILQKKYINKIQSVFKYNNNVCFTSARSNYLGELFYKYGSYKIQGYNDIYELLFFQHTNKTKLVLECGIGIKNLRIWSNTDKSRYSIPGSSLRSWRDYFPNANIIGIDINSDVMFTEDRISTFVCNQTSKQSIDNFIQQANLQPNTVDIIIDDGLHEFNANITLFENTKHLLQDNGIYVIEDFWVKNNEQQMFIDYFNHLDDYTVRFIKISEAYLIVITKTIK